jgi:hypothetical protein
MTITVFWDVKSVIQGVCVYKKPQWPESASELYRPSDRRFLAKLVPTFAVRGCHVVSVTDPYGSILGFLDRVCVCIYIFIYLLDYTASHTRRL